jgi:hypothetical protein
MPETADTAKGDTYGPAAASPTRRVLQPIDGKDSTIGFSALIKTGGWGSAFWLYGAAGAEKQAQAFSFALSDDDFAGKVELILIDADGKKHECQVDLSKMK